MSRLSSQWDCLSEEVDEKEAAERPPLSFMHQRAEASSCRDASRYYRRQCVTPLKSSQPSSFVVTAAFLLRRQL